MSTNQELRGSFIEERQRWPAFQPDQSDTVVARIRCNGEINAAVTVKGQADEGELQPGMEYRFFGHFVHYRNPRSGESEQQFQFNSFIETAPAGRDAVVGYLVSAGAGHGLGLQRARKLYDLFGESAVKMMREEPATVAAALQRAKLSVDLDNCQRVADVLQSKIHSEETQIELTQLLTGRGFPRATTRAAIQKWGTKAASIIRRNPFRLMSLPGCGFKRCDAMWLDLGLPPDKLKRQALCAWYAIHSDNEGHTWYPALKATNEISQTIAGTMINPDKALRLAIRGGLLTEEFTDGVGGSITTRKEGIRWLAGSSEAEHEQQIASAVARSLREKHSWPDVASLVELTDHQREQLSQSLRGTIAILGGSPGTGKTFTAAVLIKALVKLFGANQILVTGPTGKASVRVTENLAAHSLEMRARTTHSWLAWLERQELTHFPHQVIVCDEGSMYDTDVFARLIRSLRPGCHLLIIGDVYQLPPVGHGAPLRDLIAAGLPYGELREIKRRDSSSVNAINAACAAIRDGLPWQPGMELGVTNDATPEDQLKSILRLCNRAKAQGLDPIWDVQIICAVNEKSPMSRKTLNEVLQAELNPNPGKPNEPFRVGDKIVNTVNNTFQLDASKSGRSGKEGDDSDGGETYVANGEVAKVLRVEPKFIIAELLTPKRVIRVPRGKPDADGSGGCTFVLAYAMTCHKLQGSESQFVGLIIDEYPGARMICSREFIYTGLSRGKLYTQAIGKKETADRFCRNVSLGKRKTFLRERIAIEKARIELESI